MNNNQEIKTNFKCPLCGNSDIHSIGFLNGNPYCRKCISFKGKVARFITLQNIEPTISLTYRLSKEQKQLSRRLVNNYKNNIDSLVYAVCGSGKTEICLLLIKFCLSKKLRVGFAVPRKSVCLELGMRFKDIFKNNRITIVYGGNNKVLEGDIVCLTTHQLFRYHKYFDLLIMDEIDAFPYKGDPVLHQFFLNSVKGHYVLLSATPSKALIKEFHKPGKDVLELFARFHHHPLPVPKVEIANYFILHYKLIKHIYDFIKRNKQIFVFVPTINDSKKIALFLNVFFHSGTYINSQRRNNKQIIEKFRKGKYKFLVTTAVLERGVTVKDLQVIVFHADSVIYDTPSLIQIAGRAGRKKEAPEGEVIFLAETNTEQIKGAIAEINAANAKLQDMLQRNKRR